MVGQPHGGGVRVLPEGERATIEDPPAGIPGLCVDHLADLVMAKVVGNPTSSIAPMAGLMQQETLQGFIQGSQSLLRPKLGHLAEFLKGEVMAEDRPCCQQGAGRGRKSGQATVDQLAYVRSEHFVRWDGFEDRGLRLKHPAASRDQAGHQHATFEECLEQRPQVERLPLRFCE